MAKVEMSGMIANLTGKLNGTVFQRGRTGTVAKGLGTKIGNKSTAQQSAMNLITLSNNNWKSLTQADRNLWETFAKYINIRISPMAANIMSGREIYFKYNYYRLFYSIASQNTPIFTKPSISPLTISVTLVAGVLTVTMSRSLNPVSEIIVLEVCKPLAATILNPGKSYRLMKITQVTGTAYNITALYIAAFGRLPITGEHINFRYKVQVVSNTAIMADQYFSFLVP